MLNGHCGKTQLIVNTKFVSSSSVAPIVKNDVPVVAVRAEIEVLPEIVRKH